MRSAPRFTHDIDLAVAVEDDRAAEDLVRRLISEGYGFDASVEHDNGRLATIRLKRNMDGIPVLVDLLFASSGIEPEIVRAAENLAARWPAPESECSGGVRRLQPGT